MNAMNKIRAIPFWQVFAITLSLVVTRCSALRPTSTLPPAIYALENTQQSASVIARPEAPTLIINSPGAASGFSSSHIVYVREVHKLEYFAHSEWVDSPPRMLMPLLVSAIESSGAFHAVMLAPGAAVGDFRLDSRIIRLQHEFQTQPSRVRFTLRATLVDDKTRHVLAWREFDAVVPSASEDPYGGVVAANAAVRIVLKDLAIFCAGAVHGWKKAP